MDKTFVWIIVADEGISFFVKKGQWKTVIVSLEIEGHNNESSWIPALTVLNKREEKNKEQNV
jgi:hypothetical protein